MEKINKLIEPISRLICAAAGFTLLALGAVDVQTEKIDKGTALIGVSVPLVGFAVGKKDSKKGN